MGKTRADDPFQDTKHYLTSPKTQNPMEHHLPPHFKGKEAVEHVVEAQVQGIVDSAEIHGAETPGHISAGADAARETALVLLLLWTILSYLGMPYSTIMLVLGIFAIGWLSWKIGRSAWLAWSRLERLHRIVAEERWEIENHRQQEREELKALYAAKGFQDKLLEDVLDVLMADGDRLLKVMIEEELGLSLETYEHPLKQGLGAGIGTLFAVAISFAVCWMFPSWGLLMGALGVMGVSAALAAKYEKNRLIPAIIWNIGLGALAFGFVHFLLDFSISKG